MTYECPQLPHSGLLGSRRPIMLSMCHRWHYWSSIPDFCSVSGSCAHWIAWPLKVTALVTFMPGWGHSEICSVIIQHIGFWPISANCSFINRHLGFSENMTTFGIYMASNAILITLTCNANVIGIACACRGHTCGRDAGEDL